MKDRTKYVLEGAIVELTHNEYERYLSVNDMMVQIDGQKYLGSVTAEEAGQCADILKRVLELKANEITLLQTLSRNMFAYVRPAPVKKEEEPAITEGKVEDLNKEKAMKGIDVEGK